MIEEEYRQVHKEATTQITSKIIGYNQLLFLIIGLSYVSLKETHSQTQN